MDSLIAAAARALAAGDALGALKRVALRDDPPALALRGIAMAQLGEHARARELLRRAARGFGAHEELARARCVVAEAEVALAMRDLGGSPRALAAAAAALEARGDRANALHARLIAARRLLLLGRLDEAAAALAQPRRAAACRRRWRRWPSWPRPSWRCARCARRRRARRSPARRRRPSARGVPALLAEVAEARAALDRPAARRFHGRRRAAAAPRRGRGAARARARWWSMPAAAACARGDAGVPLARRPVLFALARALAEAWPGDVGPRRADRPRLPHPPARRDAPRAPARRDRPPARARRAAGAHRGHARAASRSRPRDGRDVAVLAPPIDGDQASLLALLADGAAWSTSALALALGASQRTVQRALASWRPPARCARSAGARAQRWLAPPLAGFTTILLLPTALPLA